MHPILLATLIGISRTVVFAEVAGIAVLLIGLLALKDDFLRARSLDKIVVLAYLFCAMPMATFGGEHLSGDKGIIGLVPKFMPWAVFWAYFVGFAWVAASLSWATKILVRWSGLLFGIAMFLFVAMMDLRGTLRNPHNRFIWALMLRELSFGGGGWLLAASAMRDEHGQGRKILFTVGRLLLGITAVFYGVQHFLHPLNVPGVPLERLMPTWMPRTLISYLTGAILFVAGAGILRAKKTRVAATYLGTWIFLLALFVYGPILVVALMDPSPAEKLEGINYFEDTLLYAGVILALANASPQET